MKQLYCILFFLLTAISRLQAQSEFTVAYIEQYKTIAIQEMKRTGIPASITLAQGILESNSGESALAKKANNHFGIKCKSDWKGETYNQDDDAKQECFRAYPTAKASYIDHSNFLKNRPNYASLFLLDPVDDSAWAFGLKKAGYATASDYPKKLLKVIDDYELSQYNFPELDDEDTAVSIGSIANAEVVSKLDTPKQEIKIILDKPTGIHPAKVSSASTPIMKGLGPIVEEKKEPTLAVSTPENTNSGATKKINPPAKKTINYPSGKFRINQVPAIWAKAGTAYLEIAMQYKIALYKLFEHNEIAETDIVDEDKIVFLAPKKKFSHKTIHVVSAGENLYDISQSEGVQLNYLEAYNSNTNTKKLKEGDVILLFKKPSTPIIKK